MTQDESPRAGALERWSAEQLELLDRARELEIAMPRSDGSVGRWTPVWVVVAVDAVLVRTWVRRDTGWYGGVLRSRSARIRVPGLLADVTVEPADRVVAVEPVDAAYRAKYGADGARSMTTHEAAASTLRLLPADRAIRRRAEA